MKLFYSKTKNRYGNGKIVPVFNYARHHEDVVGSGSIDPHILNVSTRWRWVVSFTTWPLYHWGKEPLYSLDRRLGGAQIWSGCGGK